MKISQTFHKEDDGIAEIDLNARRFLCFNCGWKIPFAEAEVEIERRELDIDQIITYVSEEEE